MFFLWARYPCSPLCGALETRNTGCGLSALRERPLEIADAIPDATQLPPVRTNTQNDDLKMGGQHEGAQVSRVNTCLGKLGRVRVHHIGVHVYTIVNFGAKTSQGSHHIGAPKKTKRREGRGIREEGREVGPAHASRMADLIPDATQSSASHKYLV